MTSFTRLLSSLKSAYNNINPATLTGAIDIIVVQQEDGTLRCTPFHVRFGKLGVLQNQQNKVYIQINGNPVEDLYMELGEAGEAVFIEEDSNLPDLSSTRHLEPSNSNTFLDPDNALTHMLDKNSQPQLSNIDCSPQINEQTARDKNEQPSVSTIDIDPLNSTIITNRRRQKRRVVNNQNDQLSSEEDNQDTEKTLPSQRRSRARQRDSAQITNNGNHNYHSDNDDDDDDDNNEINPSTTSTTKRSASENNLELFQIDDEQPSESSTPYVDAHSRLNSIDSRKKLVTFPQQASTETDEDENNRSTSEESFKRHDRTSSNPIPIEPKFLTNEKDPFFSQSAPTTNNQLGIPIRIGQSNESTSFYLNEDFTPTSSFENSSPIRPSSPKSDTEYELDKSSQQSTINNRTILGWRWKWGGFPERRNVFKYFWPSSKQSQSNEGIYLDDIANKKCDDPSRYLPEIDFQQNQRRTSSNDDDQESGKGNSLPHSPTQEHENSYFPDDIQLSLCGNLNKPLEITNEMFNSQLISFETFSNNPSIVNHPNLVVRIDGKYYDWKVGSTLIASSSILNKSLSHEVVEQLQGKSVTENKTRTTSSSSWWPFSGRKSDVTPDENVKPDRERKITITNSTSRKTLILTSDQLKRLDLKSGINHVEFSVTTALQGTTLIEANIFLFDHRTKFVISDIDGTITRSDVFGHILPLVGKDWSHDGIAQFFQAIQENGYQFIYLSARAIGQSRITRNFLQNIRQSESGLPNGPLFISPDTLVTALYREIIAKKPEDFKIECLKNIASLFPGKNPFYAGFGNRINDQWAYTAVGIPVTRIFTINPAGEVVRQKISQVLSTSYKNLHEVVDQVFPPMDSFSASESYSSFTFWRHEPNNDSLEDEMLQHLQEMTKKQKTKGKGTSTSTTGVSPNKTVIKPNGEKSLTVTQLTENTIKKS